MARIRTLKPEILEDEKTAALSDRAWRLFCSILLLADDYGNLRADARLLSAHVLWAHGSPDISANLEELFASGLLRPYTVRGQRYAAVANWDKHQRVEKPGKPRVPGPNEADQAISTTCETSSEKIPEVSRESRETLSTDLRTPTLGPPTLGPRTPSVEQAGARVTLEKFSEAIAQAGIAVQLGAKDRERFSRAGAVQPWELEHAIARAVEAKARSPGYVLSVIERERRGATELPQAGPAPPARRRFASRQDESFAEALAGVEAFNAGRT